MKRKRKLSRALVMRVFTGFVALWIGLSLALSAGCDKRERLEDKLLAERQERTALIDALYAEYGGGTIAGTVRQEIDASAQKPKDADMLGALKNLVGEVDRSVFEQQLRMLGSGDHVPALTDKAKAFYARDDVAKRAQKLTRLDHEIEETARLLAEAGGAKAP